ncbi:hypothetical protein HK405_003348, partial [Cladochytrium tenue]
MNSAESTPTPSASSSDTGGLSSSAKIGIIIACVVAGGAVLVALGFILVRSRRQRSGKTLKPGSTSSQPHLALGSPPATIKDYAGHSWRDSVASDIGSPRDDAPATSAARYRSGEFTGIRNWSSSENLLANSEVGAGSSLSSAAAYSGASASQLRPSAFPLRSLSNASVTALAPLSNPATPRAFPDTTAASSAAGLASGSVNLLHSGTPGESPFLKSLEHGDQRTTVQGLVAGASAAPSSKVAVEQNPAPRPSAAKLPALTTGDALQIADAYRRELLDPPPPSASTVRTAGTYTSNPLTASLQRASWAWGPPTAVGANVAHHPHTVTAGAVAVPQNPFDNFFASAVTPSPMPSSRSDDDDDEADDDSVKAVLAGSRRGSVLRHPVGATPSLPSAAGAGLLAPPLVHLGVSPRSRAVPLAAAAAAADVPELRAGVVIVMPIAGLDDGGSGSGEGGDGTAVSANSAG